MTGSVLAAGLLALIAVVHSGLGEVGIVRPLLAQEWQVDEPRWAVERIIRLAWHLTSFAWLALAAALLEVDLLPTVAVMSLASAALVFVMLRGHLAWPLFLLAGLAAARAEGWLGVGTLQLGAIVGAIALGGAALLHVYWATGGEWMLDAAIPGDGLDGRGTMPGPGLTLLVAVALAVFAGLVVLSAYGRGPSFVPILTWIGVGVLTVRAIGDTKTAGFTKTDHESTFGRADDLYFTPLITLLALAATGAVLAV